MKLTTTLYIVICIFSIDKIYSNSNIDELKRSSNNYISDLKNEFLSIKNKIISPYNKKQFHCETYIDSLHFLSEKFDWQWYGGHHHENEYTKFVKGAKFPDEVTANKKVLTESEQK